MMNPTSPHTPGKMLLLLMFLVGLVGCSTFGTTTLDVAPKAPNSVLMILRIDEALTTKDEVKVVLNGKETIELGESSYKIVHLRPGKYEVEYIFNKAKNDKTKKKGFTGTIEPNTKNMVELAPKPFVGWRGSTKFWVRDKFTALRKLKNGGEVDLTGTLEPLAAK